MKWPLYSIMGHLLQNGSHSLRYPVNKSLFLYTKLCIAIFMSHK